MTALCLILTAGALADILGSLINGHETYLGAGMELSKGVYWTGSDYQTENYIEYTPSQTITPVVVSGSKVCNYGNFSSMAALLEKQGKHVIAGINGDYFVVANYEPLGIVLENGELLSSDADHWAIGFKDDGSAIFGQPDLQITLNIGGTDFALDGINKTRRDGGAVLYTDDYATATKNTGDGTDIVMTLDGTLAVSCTRGLTAANTITTGGAVAIPAGKAVLSISANATDDLKAAAATLTEGATATLTISCASGWTDVRYAIGSLHKLITNGVVVAGLPTNENAPRTAVGMKADGSLVFYTIDGRKSGYSVGVTIAKLAQRMLELGCVEATIMDGGGSTSLNAIYIGDSSASQINSPSDGYQRSVTDYIMLVTETKPTGQATRLALYPLVMNSLLGASGSFTLKAADDNGYAAALSSPASLSVTGGVGTIAADGTFKATAAGSGNVTAQASGLTGASVQLNVVATPDSITVKNESTSKAVSTLSVATESVTSLTALAMKNHVSLISQDNCYTWSVTGGIGTISVDGTFTATTKDAVGSITVKAGDTTVTIPVTVVNPEKFDDVLKTDWFHDAVKYIGDKGVITGTATRTFSPNVSVTRAMAVTVLYRLAGSPEIAASGTAFADVPEGQWYAKAVYWANALGIAQGYAGSFSPDSAITREQLATMLYRYSAASKTSADLSAFTDAGQISSYAVDAMSWAYADKLISGVTDTTLSPQSTATRAQLAMILFRMSN